jgi:PAS domain S-box-containing protein
VTGEQRFGSRLKGSQMAKTSILIVEDESIVALDIENSLSSSGYSIVGKTDRGEDAVKLAKELRPDLVLMDIGLRGELDGIEAAIQIRRKYDLPIIFLTAFTTPTILERARKAEPFGYVVKPFDERELNINIEMAIYKHTTERKLRASENKFRGVIENSSDAIALTDEFGCLIEWNRAAEQITGLMRSEVLGLPQWEVVFRMLPEHQKTIAFKEMLKEQWRAVVASGYESGLDRLAEIEIETQSGEQRVIQSNGFVIESGLGKQAGTIMRDITERKKMEDNLREILHREQLLGDIVRQTSLMIGVFGLDGKRMMVNDATLQQTGYTEMELLDPEKDIDLTPPELQGNESARLNELRQTKNAIRYQTEVLRKDGSRFPVDATIRPHFNSAGDIDSFFILASDITIRKEFEIEREKLVSELQKKNTELEQFTYTVSHDLKAPLITIRGFLGFLERDIQAGHTERIRSDISRIADATDKMQQLIYQLLDLSRVGRITNPAMDVPFDVIVNDAINIVAGQIAERGAHVNISPNLPIIHGDKVRLTQVMQNLIENAIKFMGEQPEPRIDIGLDGMEDGKPVFYVRDNGVGIPSEHHERIFGLFNKLNGNSDGTGIGLALVKRIIEVHGGKIWVQSEAGKGATFYFSLARSDEKGWDK